MKAWQKVCLRGNSAYVTLPRPLMYQLGILPGDIIAIEPTGDGTATLRKIDPDQNASLRSIGLVSDRPEMVKA